ncbi:GDSL-type esterase/lipase family protein [Streptomyces sp. SL13]|uniref:GDSL-type esterase/lipase family protein n=1 Tax=Streptantibioticus silvisoli TaxID=2705255 RepID=A0AA90HAX9_9ACTN|nr:GDSL-type esterase/lipase family protein [Streptantibioticus silvisoli]MDI5973474.1 GDSL-type esterase/lipase family protein [Streptantibioticus silvisoli]
MSGSQHSGTRRVWIRRGRTTALVVLLLVAVGAVSIWLAVRITPTQSVAAAGQDIQVGAVQPTLSLSGHGELDLFGEAIPTRPRFPGPIRPRLRLAHISIDSQVNEIARSSGHDTLEVALSRQLAAGWTRYCAWEILIAAGCAAVILVAVTGLGRTRPRGMLALVAAGVVTVVAVNAVGVYLLASGTPDALKHVHTLDDLVGRTPTQPVRAARGPALPDVNVVVLGDSTAAGLGNPLVAHPTALDRVCGRSSDAYAADLASVNHWNVLNLACQGATVRDGVLGVQIRGDQVVPPQLAVALRATKVSTVVVSIGANDMNWAVLTGLCAASPVCDDKASTAYFTKQLDAFNENYLDLLHQLATLPHHPAVLINDYYDPFGPDTRCLAKEGITATKAAVLGSRLDDLNSVLDEGARTFHFRTAEPSFDGHRLCSDQPYVQNTAGQAPLHPTAAGELAIALADEQALTAPGPQDRPAASPSPSTSTRSTAPAPSASSARSAVR